MAKEHHRRRQGHGRPEDSRPSDAHIENRFGRDITNMVRPSVLPESASNSASAVINKKAGFQPSAKEKKLIQNEKVKAQKKSNQKVNIGDQVRQLREEGMDLNNAQKTQLVSVYHRDILAHLQEQEVTSS